MTSATLMSVSEYLNSTFRPDRDYVDGVLIERNVGERKHSLTQVEIAHLFRLRRESWNVQVMTEQRVRIEGRRYRVPDICVVLRPAAKSPVLTEPPFLCIEILSPDDSMSEMLERIADYLTLGVPHVWIVDPYKKRGWGYRREGSQESPDGILRTSSPEFVIDLNDVWQILEAD